MCARFHGCQKACAVYQNITAGDTGASADSSSWIIKRDIQVLDFPESSTSYVDWNEPAAQKRQDFDKRPSFIYLIAQKNSDEEKWTEVFQTKNRHASLSFGMLNRKGLAQLFVVTKEGVVAKKQILVSHKETEHKETAEAIGWTAESWVLRLLSLQRDINQQTEAVISWDSLPRAVKYDVAWRILDDSMDITGHLYTWTNITSLSLMFSSVYSVQVSGVNKDGKLLGTSSTLIVNTKTLDEPVPEQAVQATATSCLDSDSSLMLVLVYLGAVSLFVSVCCIVFFVFICLKHKRRANPQVESPQPSLEKALSPLPLAHKKLSLAPQLSHEKPGLSLVKKLSRKLSNLEMQYSPLSPLRQCQQREGGQPAEDQKHFLFPEDENVQD